MWVIAEYAPTSLFSLRPANATTSGGKSLITPTPYAIKMALLDAAIRIYGKTMAQNWFPALRNLQVAIALPQHITVVNTFVKILRPHKNGPKDTLGTGLVGPMGSTIAYRELVQFPSSIKLAVQNMNGKGDTPPLLNLLLQINYLGKRGGFMQPIGLGQIRSLSEEFVGLNGGKQEMFPLHGTLQILDDCGAKMTFEHADVYNSKSVAVNRPNGRILNSVILPYRPTTSSRGYTLYRRVA